MNGLRRIIVSAAVLATCAVGCKTTYTPEDLREIEREQQENLAAEQERVEHLTAGENSEALREQEDEIIRETDR